MALAGGSWFRLGLLLRPSQQSSLTHIHFNGSVLGNRFLCPPPPRHLIYVTQRKLRGHAMPHHEEEERAFTVLGSTFESSGYKL